MPIITSNYNPSFLFKYGFISTLYSGLVRKVKGVTQVRERLTLSDGDFLDLDWSYTSRKTNQLIIILHGLGGNAQRPYMTGTAKLFNNQGIDAVCVNFRSCSGEQNLKYRSYHSGATEDLEDIIQHIISTKHYSDIFIKGFSLGGNIALKLLGERNKLPIQIKACIAISVPCDLYGSCMELHAFKNILYHHMFKKHLIEKLKEKQNIFPDKVSDTMISSIKTLKDFDDLYTSKVHGFKDALDYYKKCSSLQFLQNIKIPTLIINAQNDSFLSSKCYPREAAINNSNLYLEMPKYGGHVGFFNNKNGYYNERRALEFINQVYSVL